MNERICKTLASIALCFGVQAALCQTRYTVSDENASGASSSRAVILRDNMTGTEATIVPMDGGELSSFGVGYKGRTVELLYQTRELSASPATDALSEAVFLWPAVGVQYPSGTRPMPGCGEGSYRLDGKQYPMPCDGFARLLPWKEISRSVDAKGARITVQLRDSSETQMYYPFAFHLDITYEIADGHLTINYVINSDPFNAKPMAFSLGSRMPLKVPFLEGSDPAKMLFETQSTSELLQDSLGVFAGEERKRPFAMPEVLGDFDKHGAHLLAGYRSQPFVRVIDPQGLALRVTQTGSSALPEPLVRTNAYGDPKEGYFNPDPWFGLQNSLNTGVGLIKLNPGQSWKWRLELQVDGPPPLTPKDDSGVTRFAGPFPFVEGPVWVKRGYLLFSDMYNSRILKMSSAAPPTIYREFTNAANGNSMDAQGRLYSCERDGHRVVRLEKNGRLTAVASKFEGKRFNSPNDAVVRHDGQVYFSDPAAAAVLEPRELAFNGLYHVNPRGVVTLIAKLTRPNGVALDESGRLLYVTDTDDKCVYAFDLDSDGNASHQRLFIPHTNGRPDGVRVAVSGNLYVATSVGIEVYDPNGNLLRTIEFPEAPTNCAFGDADMKTLYVTARTSIYRVRVADRGSSQY